MDGSPRSAKAAGAKLRKLTKRFQERLMLEGGVSPDDLYKLSVRTSFWMPDMVGGNFDGRWQHGVRHLLGHGGEHNGGTLFTRPRGGYDIEYRPMTMACQMARQMRMLETLLFKNLFCLHLGVIEMV